MATPILTETIDTCEVCGEVACERDLVQLDADEAEALDLEPGATVCTECHSASGERQVRRVEDHEVLERVRAAARGRRR